MLIHEDVPGAGHSGPNVTKLPGWILGGRTASATAIGRPPGAPHDPELIL